MPDTIQILSGLKFIANEYIFYATLWHAVLYFFIAALVMNWLPSNRLFGFLICLPLISVAFFAFSTGNPFNAVMFSIAAILIFIFSTKASKQKVTYSKQIFVIAGAIMIVFGLVYPHFLEADSILQYLYASPAGLIPCPTLSIIIGFALAYNGFDSRPVTIVLICFGIFYGFFGVFKLGVYIDVFLILGTIALLAKYVISYKAMKTRTSRI